MKLFFRKGLIKKNYTEGKLYINGNYFCNYLDIENLISPDSYKVVFKYSTDFNKVLPYLESMTKSSSILLYYDTTNKSSTNYILIGKFNSLGELAKREDTFKEFCSIIKSCPTITLEIE
jgi:hypothetical protein